MYYIKENVELINLEKYGFKIGHEIPDNERCICGEDERNDYWLIPMNPDMPEEVFYADDDFDQPIWSVHIQNTRRVWIECVPSCTYHIDNMDMDRMFYVLKCMIEDGLIEDDYVPETY
jgi:hypothetical protein